MRRVGRLPSHLLGSLPTFWAVPIDEPVAAWRGLADVPDGVNAMSFLAEVCVDCGVRVAALRAAGQVAAVERPLSIVLAQSPASVPPAGAGDTPPE